MQIYVVSLHTKLSRYIFHVGIRDNQYWIFGTFVDKNSNIRTKDNQSGGKTEGVQEKPT